MEPVRPIQLAASAVFAALVCVATMVFTVYVPLTRGFFNIGETMVYTTALLFGPYVGAFAGGVGSMAADMLLGYPHYAPATLVIKAAEGYIVGFLSRKRPKSLSSGRWKLYTTCLGVLAGALIAVIGSRYYSGMVELYLGYPPPQQPTLVIYVPAALWYGLGLVVASSTVFMGLRFEPEFGWLVFSILVGGLEMVAGYFLYEQFLLGVAAIVEVPVNVGQMAVGLLVAIPLVRALWRSMPGLQRMVGG